MQWIKKYEWYYILIIFKSTIYVYIKIILSNIIDRDIYFLYIIAVLIHTK